MDFAVVLGLGDISITQKTEEVGYDVVVLVKLNNYRIWTIWDSHLSVMFGLDDVLYKKSVDKGRLTLSLPEQANC